MALPVVARKVTKKITENRKKNILNVQESEGSKKYFEQIAEEGRSL